MKYALVSLSIAILLAAAGVLFLVSRFTMSALPEPGRIETYLAGKAKQAFIHRSAHGALPAAPLDVKASIEEGDKLFGSECAACHGLDGHKPTDAGRWMYPRAADLTSRNVQEYSDQELFWIVKNGVRLSGMPAFGEVETNEHIWNLVHYVRTLAK